MEACSYLPASVLSYLLDQADGPPITPPAKQTYQVPINEYHYHTTFASAIRPVRVFVTERCDAMRFDSIRFDYGAQPNKGTGFSSRRLRVAVGEMRGEVEEVKMAEAVMTSKRKQQVKVSLVEY
jgi:hypothetical protein